MMEICDAWEYLLYWSIFIYTCMFVNISLFLSKKPGVIVFLNNTIERRDWFLGVFLTQP